MGTVLTGGGGNLIPPTTGQADITETIPLLPAVGVSPNSWKATAAWDGAITGTGGDIQAWAVCAQQ